MDSLTTQMRELARKLLASGKVALVIGPGTGTLPQMARATFARAPEEADQLQFSPAPMENLAGYLHYAKPDQAVAFIVRGCEGRALVECIAERQFAREQITIITYPCPGMVAPAKVARLLEIAPEAIEALEVESLTLKVTVGGNVKELPLVDVWQNNCRECKLRTSPEADYVLEGPAYEPVTEEFSQIAAVEALPAEERWQLFQSIAERCVRCYACRNACPLCYCDECFVDCKSPVYVRNASEPSDNHAYHITRALHLAGRCVDCGACSRACPVGIDLRFFNKRLEETSLTAFNYRSGSASDQKPVLSEQSAQDPEDFILK